MRPIRIAALAAALVIALAACDSLTEAPDTELAPSAAAPVDVILSHGRALDARVGARELLLIDRDPWSLELRRYERGELRTVSVSNVRNRDVVTSVIVPLSFQLIDASPRPRLEIAHLTSDRHWLI